MIDRPSRPPSLLLAMAFLAGTQWAIADGFPVRGPFFPFDQRVVEDRWQVDRVVVPLSRHSKNPLLQRDQPWEGTGPLAGGSVLRDPADGLFKMWYTVWDQHAWENKLPFGYNVCYAESRDGLAWIKPALGLFDYQGSRSNNCIRLGRAKTQNIDVELNPAPATARERFIAIHNDRGGVFLSTSGDGRKFECSFDSPAISYHSDTHNNFVYDEVRKKWLMVVRPKAYAGAGLPNVGRRRVAVLESADLKQWTTERTVLVPEEGDPDHFYGMTVFRRGDLFLGALQRYETVHHHLDVELAWSPDGYLWHRLRSHPPESFLSIGPPGAWDAGMVFLMDKPVEVGDETWFYYGGSASAHNVIGVSALGLATTKRDRLIGLRARPGQSGRLLTRPFAVSGDLWINAESKGALRVSVHTPQDDPLPGWTAEDCDSFQGDTLGRAVRWAGKSLSDLRGQEVRLRFHLQEATLYAFDMRP